MAELDMDMVEKEMASSGMKPPLDFHEVCERAAKTWPAKEQLGMLAEESSELAVAVHHVLRGRSGASSAMLGEMADVFIMLRQAELILGFSPEDVSEAIQLKLQRLVTRMDAHDTKAERAAERSAASHAGYHMEPVPVAKTLPTFEIVAAHHQGARAREAGRSCGCPKCEP